MDKEWSAHARAAIFEAIDTRLQDRDPPRRPRRWIGCWRRFDSRDEADRLIGCALADELLPIMEHEREYDGA